MINGPAELRIEIRNALEVSVLDAQDAMAVLEGKHVDVAGVQRVAELLNSIAGNWQLLAMDCEAELLSPQAEITEFPISR